MAASPSPGGSDLGSIPGLLTRLADDAMALARNEIALAKAEARGVVRDVKLSVAPFTIAAGVLLMGAMTLVAAAVLALAEVLRPWVAALIVAVALLLIGWLLLKAGQRKWQSIGDHFDRTQDSLHRDATLVARRTS
ncbi:phage holin family protein [Steroidobacter flavus]|uniref:Phage holin family protein n=1 Tax=Steroidobacter flavus TaxID=1842136 RepID=A0ABV8T0J5_9GAMM